MKFRYSPFLGICILVCSLSAFATDGIVLLNQNTATVGRGGCDTPGFPITICVSGSYRLSGKLVVPSGAVAIKITVSNVTLDLNGFSITTTPVFPYNQIGVLYAGPTPGHGLTIENGTIFGFGSPYLDGGTFTGSETYINGAQSVLKDLTLLFGVPGTSTSILFGPHSRIVNVSAPDFDLLPVCPTLIADTVARSIGNFFGGPCNFVNNATDF